MTSADRTETPAAGLGPPGPVAGSTPDAAKASGGSAPGQRADTPAAPGAAAKLKMFQDTCKALGMTGDEAATALRSGGWTLPHAWWKTIEGWTADDLAEACQFLETGAQDPPLAPEQAEAVASS
jgi:hypothetical protein